MQGEIHLVGVARALRSWWPHPALETHESAGFLPITLGGRHEVHYNTTPAPCHPRRGLREYLPLGNGASDEPKRGVRHRRIKCGWHVGDERYKQYGDEGV
ncbi:hypothetical protein GCM10027343_36190 [Noviherbaspirillum agri]